MSIQSVYSLVRCIFSTAFLILLMACNGGGKGDTGPAGPTGPTPTPTLNLAALTAEQWAVLEPQGRITAVTMGAAPIVDFELKDPAGNGLIGLGAFTSQASGALSPSYPNLAFTIAKLVPEDAVSKAPSRWVSYIVDSMPTTTTPRAPSRPTSDSTGTLVDNGDGTYRYTFYRNITTTQAFLDGYTYTGNNLRADLGNASYEPDLTHRLVIQVYGNARGTGSNTPTGATTTTAVPMKHPINVIYDFVPSKGAPLSSSDTRREISATAKCAECHGNAFATTPHTGRVEVGYCVVCHTDQRKYGRAIATAGTTTTYTGSTYKFALDANTTTAAGDMTAMVHRIHMGTLLSKTGYDYAGTKFETLGYSMLDGGQRMCSKCHSAASDDASATLQGDNWYLKPTRQTCGTCHDAIDFAAGTGHSVQTSDVACAGCHIDNSSYPEADIQVAHRTANLTTHNPTITSGLWNFNYEIQSATQATSGGPVTIIFRFLTDGGVAGAAFTPVTTLNTTAVSGGVGNPLPGFTGAPGFILAWAMPQEGYSSPADFNNLLANGTPSASNFQPRTVSIKDLLDTDKAASVGTLSGPNSEGYYTANIVGANAIFPTGATMRTVALQGYFTQISPAVARHAISVTKTVDGDTARRQVVDNAKCANCHEWFEGHGGSRVYNIQVCTPCHVPGLVTSGRGMTDSALSTYYPSFSTRDKASLTKWTSIDFSVNPVLVSLLTNVALNFPQTSNNLKDMIHGIHAGKDRNNPIAIVRDRTPNAVNVIDGANIGFPGVLSNCTNCHTYNTYSGTPSNTLATREQAINTAGNTTTALAKTALASINDTDLMTTPFTASCISCHDSVPSKAHMTLNGGQILVARSTLNSAGESCAVCHGPGSTYDPVVSHK